MGKHVTFALFLTGLVLWASAGFSQGESQQAYEEFVKANELAAAGAITRSIPHYERVLELAPEQYPLAFYNLGEVFRAKKDCPRAALMYQLYERFGADEATKKEASTAREGCVEEDWPSLSVRVEPEHAEVRLSGQLVSRGKLEGLRLAPGSYELSVSATDHEPTTQKVVLERAQEREITVALEEQTFYGKILVKVDAHPGARIKIHEGPSEDSKVLHEFTAPMRQPVEITSGRHFVEVTKEGYERWIRNVSVPREDDAVVDVRLSRSLPEEIR